MAAPAGQKDVIRDLVWAYLSADQKSAQAPDERPTGVSNGAPLFLSVLRVIDLTAAWPDISSCSCILGQQGVRGHSSASKIGRQSGVACDRTHGVALPRCSDGSGCAVSDEGATAHPFLGAYRVQLELSVRTTLRNQRLAALVSGTALTHDCCYP